MPILQKMQDQGVKWLNEKEVANITGSSVCTLRNNRCKGIGIPHYKVGRSVRYLNKDVIEYMEKHKVMAA